MGASRKETRNSSGTVWDGPDDDGPVDAHRHSFGSAENSEVGLEL